MAENNVKSVGWVMIHRKTGYICEWTFCTLRRDSIGEMQTQWPTYTRRQILRRWKPAMAVQTTSIVFGYGVN